jgi:cation diffusion facilitator family transporter
MTDRHHDHRGDHDHPGHDGHHLANSHGHDDVGHGVGRLWQWVRQAVVPHSHDSADKIDAALATSRDGLRALWLSLVILGGTAVAQAALVLVTGSVALLSDTLHNVADALTAVPLGIAFLVGRRAATRAYTYGFGRAEDLAGIAIVATILASAVLAGWQAVDRLIHPTEVDHLAVLALAGLIGFVGNEWVAQYRIRVGRRLGSAALVADGLHARTDGFTSLAVVASAAGVAAGWRRADAVVGLAITVTILFVLKDAATEVYRRLMDAVDPELVARIETSLRGTAGVRAAPSVRVRWVGHQLRTECIIVVDPAITVTEAHAIAADAEHALLHAISRLTEVLIHTDPQTTPGADPHETLAHHR